MLNVKSFQIENFIPADYQNAAAPRLAEAQEKLQKHTGAGHEFTDWVRLPVDYDKEEFTRIQAAAKKIIKPETLKLIEEKVGEEP